MEDYFALLNLPRRPWLDPEEVQARFLACSMDSHPDRFHNASEERKAEAHQRFSDFNAAARRLRDPKDRLRHLLELERAAPVSQLDRLPSGAVESFFQLGQSIREVDAFLAEQAKSQSPLARVRVFQTAMEWRERLEAAQGRLAARQAELTSEMKALNATWEAAPLAGSEARRSALPLERLETIYREFSFVVRWADQVRDRVVQLTL